MGTDWIKFIGEAGAAYGGLKVSWGPGFVSGLTTPPSKQAFKEAQHKENPKA